MYKQIILHALYKVLIILVAETYLCFVSWLFIHFNCDYTNSDEMQNSISDFATASPLQTLLFFYGYISLSQYQ